ncbi:DUF6294 family protein [Bacillus cereus]|uniref:DUF6294 family protein n=1 Tax=Bacillus cereus TaxID=1396 RepID=UPI002D76D2C5|nr:DUF6294 family protein [Bacillus cereus]HDR6819317.1 hypothetical protein [Bacillus thuringiensis]
MDELNKEEKIYTEEKKNTKNQNKKCTDIPPVDAESIPLEASLEMREAPRQKLLNWSGQVYHVGDCTIQNMRVFFWSDGRARFEAHVKSSDSDDRWVFYDGISISDKNGVQLWRSQKLVGPEMPWPNHTRDWIQEFFYPAIWFDSIHTAKCHRMHC